LLPLKLLVDADDWLFLGKTKLIIFYIFCPPPPVQITFPCHSSSLCFIKFLIKLSHRIIPSSPRSNKDQRPWFLALNVHFYFEK